MKILWLQVFETNYELENIYISFVFDKNDAQILQDAVDLWAEYILTNNTKDFRIYDIYNKFDIKIISNIDDII